MELDLNPVGLRWPQVRHPKKELGVHEPELLRMMKRLHAGTTIADLFFRSSETGLGHRFVEQPTSIGVHAHHSFYADSNKSRRQKLWFFLGKAKTKATTPHSFKD